MRNLQINLERNFSFLKTNKQNKLNLTTKFTPLTHWLFISWGGDKGAFEVCFVCQTL